MILDSTAEKIALTLTRKTRVMTLQQVADCWFSGSISTARKHLKQLIDFGYLDSFQELVGPRLKAEAPLMTWVPSDSTIPDFQKLAYLCKKRWTEEASLQTIFFSTREANIAFAGFKSGKPPASLSLRHDLQVAEVYITYLTARGSEWKRWQGEDQLKFDGYCRGKNSVPDAAIRSRKRRQEDIVVEIGGQYNAKRLEDFHFDFQAFRYEIW